MPARDRRLEVKTQRQRAALGRVVARRSDLDAGRTQRLADRLDSEALAMLVDAVDHGRVWRSGSAAAKNAEAVFRISFARRSSKFSRRSRLTSSCSSLVTPGR